MPEEKPKKEKEVIKEVKDSFVVTDVTTQTAPMILDVEKQEVLSIEVALAKILNELKELRKALQ